LHTALRAAERQDLILRNPAALADHPKRGRVRLDIWTEVQTLLFLSEAKVASIYYALYFFIVGTGVRIGEALGYRWRDLSFRERTVTIVQQLQRPPGGGFNLKEPKTPESARTIDLSEEVIQALKILRQRRNTEAARRSRCPLGEKCRRQHCAGWHELDLVFSQPNGKPLFDNNIRLRDLYPLCRRLGLPWRRALHNMRHGHGSHLLERGVPLKVVQERLGHKDAAFTLRTYAHVLRGMQAQAARAISAMLKTGAEQVQE
jgi:integrase